MTLKVLVLAVHNDKNLERFIVALWTQEHISRNFPSVLVFYGSTVKLQVHRALFFLHPACCQFQTKPYSSTDR